MTDREEELLKDRNIEITALKRQVKKLTALLKEVAKQHGEPCRFDHHDFCQNHLSHEPCLYQRIKDAIE